MASCITPTFGSSTCPQVELTVVVQSQTATTATLAWELDYRAHGYAAYTGGNKKSYTAVVAGATVASGSYDINGKTGSYKIASGTKVVNKTTSAQTISFSCSMAFNITWSGTYGGTKSASGSLSISAKNSYTISYNSNSTGVTNMPGTQTKWAGQSIKIAGVWPLKTGHNFAGWATSSTGSVVYQPGSAYSADASVTLYAKWTPVNYTVSYNANGGSGAPGNQTKTYGVNILLSSTKPTRSGYNFKGWGTSASSTTVAYAAGGTYSQNASITLYAIWEIAYTKPRITNVSVDRCNSAGTLDDDGSYALVKFDWATDENVEYISITCDGVISDSMPSGKSGSVSKVVGVASLHVEESYPITIEVADTSGSTTRTATVPAASYILDFSPNGGVGIGEVAPDNDRLGINKITRFSKPKYFTTGATAVGTGYARVCVMTAKFSNRNASVAFVISQRGQSRPVSIVHMTFMNRADTIIEVANAYVIGNSTVYYVESGSSCEIWVMKSESYDTYVTLCDMYEATPYNNFGNYMVYDYTTEYAATLPSGAVKFANWIGVQGTNSRPVIMQHIGLANGVVLQGQLTSGGYANILAMNTSNQVELNWTSGGLKGRVMKQIWNGDSTAGGRLVVSEFPYYNIFVGRFLVQNNYITAIGLKSGGLSGTINFSAVYKDANYYWIFSCNMQYYNSTSYNILNCAAKYSSWNNSTVNAVECHILGLFGVL